MDSLQNFFYPRSVALIGATDKPSKPGRAILENLSRFQGAVYPVNPKQFALRPALFCVNLIPDSVDLAVIALPAPLVPEEIDRVHEKGIRCVIIISSGFAESGKEGVFLQRRVSEATKKSGMSVLGPNALGIFNADNGLDTFFVSRERVSRPPAGRLSIISQSGAITVILIEALARDGIGVAKAVNYGNRLDVDDADCLDYLAEDPSTAAVAMYMESVGDGRNFLQTAKRFTAKKPVVVWKAGKFESGGCFSYGHSCRTVRGLPGSAAPGARNRGIG